MNIRLASECRNINLSGADGSALDGHLAPKIEAAKRWLGDRYLLAKPIKRKISHAKVDSSMA